VQAAKNLLNGPLANQNMLVAMMHYDRKPAAGEIEWDLIDFAEAIVDPENFVQIDMLQHGDVEQILQAGLKVTVEISVLQHPVRIFAVDVEVALQDDTILRQRSGLIGAQHVHCAEILNRIEPFDDDLLARHRDRALPQVHRHDHRQHFGREADRDRDREQQRFQPIAFGHPVDDEHRRHHDQHEADHQPGEPIDALVEGGRHASSGYLVHQLPEKSCSPGPHDDSGRIPAQYIGAHEADVM
jgi:hypothetical protein